MIDIAGISLEDHYYSKTYQSLTLYFEAPVALLNGRYPEADSAEISIEFPVNLIEPAYARVMLSPTKSDGDGGSSDYDWSDWDISYEDIDRLMDMATDVIKTVLSDYERGL